MVTLQEAHRVVREGGLDDVRRVISQDALRLVHIKDSEGRAPLHHAAELGRTRVIAYLMSRGADILAKDSQEKTALHWAVEYDRQDAVQMLLNFNSSCRARDIRGCTPLHYAVRKSYHHLAAIIIATGVDINAGEYEHGRTALQMAAELGDVVMTEQLILAGADIELAGDAYYSQTALHLACQCGHSAVVQLLLSRDATIDGPKAMAGLLDHTPLQVAAKAGHTECVKLLLDAGANVNVIGSLTNGNSSLHLAAISNHENVVKVLLEGGADPNIRGKFTVSGTPLHTAAENDSVETAARLISVGADCNFPNDVGKTPLHVACESGSYDIAAAMMDAGGDALLTCFANRTCLDYVRFVPVRDRLRERAYEIRDEKRFLEAERREKEKQSEQLELALMINEERRMHQWLQEEGIRKFRYESFLQRLIQIVDASGDMETFAELVKDLPEGNFNLSFFVTPIGNELEEVAIPLPVTNTSDTINPPSLPETSTALTVPMVRRTALTRAAERGFFDIVSGLLLWPDIDINLTDGSGETALHHAARRNDRTMVELLLYHGISHTISNVHGHVAANLAPEGSLRELLRNPRLLNFRQQYQHDVLATLFARRAAAQGEQPLALVDTTTEAALVACVRSLQYLGENPSNGNTITAEGKPVVPSLALSTMTTAVSTNLTVHSPTENTLSDGVSSSRRRLNNALSEAVALSQPEICLTGTETFVDELVDHAVTDKYGPLPVGFGGTRADIFSAGRKSPLTPSPHTSISGVYGLQADYLPESFDNTAEWEAVRDGLWMLGQPYIPKLRVRFPMLTTPRLNDTGEVPNTARSMGLRDIRAVNARDVIRSARKDADETHFRLSGLIPTTTDNDTKDEAAPSNPFSNKSMVEDVREILYQIAIVMERLQTLFTNPLCGEQMIVPHSLTSDGTFRWSQDTIAQLLSKLSNVSTPRNISSLPPHISHDDLPRLLLFSLYVWRLISLLVYLYAPTTAHTAETIPKKKRLAVYWQTLQYIASRGGVCLCSFPSGEILTIPIEDSDEGRVPSGATVIGQLFLTSVMMRDNIEPLFRICDLRKLPYQISSEEIDVTEIELEWSSLVMNPPRSLRIAMDATFEVTSALWESAHKWCPTDVIRAQLQVHWGCIVLTRSLAEERRRLQTQTSITASNTTDGSNCNNIHLPNSNITDTDITNKFSPRPDVNAPPPTALQLWLAELHLLSYESFFTEIGFRVLSDFAELSSVDCHNYFPFLQIGDLRRLARHCETLAELDLFVFEERARKLADKT